ncbi:MAG: hypothetical protein F6J87_18280 [Spirulina sp. SIO3F2]|nr:hypothetical protein [Spirulina sp. SIO3F2]
MLVDIAGTGLDSSGTPNGFPSASSGFEECWGVAHYTKTNGVVDVIARIVVANRRAAIPRIVVPGTAPQQLGCPPHCLV